MQSAELINEIFKTFPNDDAVNLIKAYQQDQYLWEQLQSSEFFQKSQDMLGNKVWRWKPANLSRINLGINPEVDVEEDLENHPTELRRTANRLLEKVINAEEINKSFYNVSLLTLATTGLFQDQKLSWKEILSELLSAIEKYSLDYAPFWQSIFSCLYTSLDQEEYINLLLRWSNTKKR